MATTTMLASSTRTRIVHFDNECVIIPEPERRRNLPKLVTKSYSLPLWKRRVSPSPVVPATELDALAASAETAAEGHVVVKLPLPSISLKSPSRSPEQTFTVPASILVHQRDPSHSPERTPRMPARRPSLPLPPRSPPVTVPLRPCCADCVPRLEACLRQGAEWEEQFSRSARRKRSLSVDSISSHPHLHSPRILHQADMAAVFSSIKVDEVDRHKQPSTSSSEGGSLLGPSISRRDGPLAPNVLALPDVIDLNDDFPRTARSDTVSTPILEEDEEQLFPLPSPRRTPSPSPAPSPNASSSSLVLAGSKRSSPGPSSPVTRAAVLARSVSSPVMGSASDLPGSGRCDKGLLTASPMTATVAAPDATPPTTPSLAMPVRPRAGTAPSAPATLSSLSGSPVSRAPPPTGSPKLGSPQSSPRTPSSPPAAQHHQHHSWTSFFRVGAEVLRGVSSMGGPSGVAR